MKNNVIYDDFQSSLEKILKEGARKMIHLALENEINEFLKNYSNQKGIKRNGYLPERFIQTGIGNISIKKPRVRGIEFTSSILPRYMRRVPSIEATISALYLRGVSTNNMQEALEAILGDNAKDLSPTNIVRLKEHWENKTFMKI